MKYGKRVLAMFLSAALMAGMVNSVPVFAEEVTAETETLAETETPMEPETPEETGTSTGAETSEETGMSIGAETPEETGMSTGAETKAATVTTSGSCGENATYSLVDGVLTISGSGKITDNPWDDTYTNDIKNVVIQKGITDIGEWIFLGHSNLTSVSLPAGLKSIESGAFSRCTSLTSISLPAGLTSIEKGTFSKCSSLTSISLPAGLTSIGNSAFAECSSLKGISLPTGLTSVGEMAFMECSSLTSISIPESVTSMGGFVFSYCSSLKSISLPTGLTSIGEAAFYGCYSLASISIPEKVTSIGQLAFYDCISLKKISISTGLTSIGYGAFSSLPSLEEIKVADGNPAYTVINGCLLTKDKRTLLIVPAKKQGVLIIPEGVKNIEEAAVENCVSLTKIMVPASVTNIKNKGLLIESTAPSIYFYGDAVEDTGDMFYNQWYDTEQFQEKYETSPSFRLSYGERLERASNIKIYTLEGTKGWEKLKEAYPRAQWLTYSNKSYYNLLKDGGTWDGTYYTRAEGMIAKNAFFFDGVHTYYLQADGTPMKDRLTYHPDGEHIIYFDKDGHEVFNAFQYCSSVGYTCYFDSNGYIYKDQITFVGDKIYYLNANGKMENEGWFQFANGRDFGYANWDGTLNTGGFSYDPWGRVVFYHWNGMVARGLITDGQWYYLMDETDGHYLGSFPVN